MPPFSTKIYRNKSLIFLVVLGVMLLAAVMTALFSLYLEQQSTVFAVQENAVWAAYQLDREVAKLQTSSALFAAGRRTETLAQISERYDILYSRVDIVNRTLAKNGFAGAPKIGELVSRTTKAVYALAPTFDALKANAQAGTADLSSILDQLARLRPTTEALVLEANQRQGEMSTIRRDEIGLIYRLLAAAFAAFTITLTTALLILLHQLRKIEQARLQSEALSRELKLAATAAEAANIAKSAFLATMSHEIRTPLNGVLGMVELLEGSELTPLQQEKVQSIRDCGTALIELVNDVLDFSKLESGNIDLERRAFQLGDIVDGVMDLLENRARERGLAVLATYPDRTLVGDPTRLRQILLNLIGNAVKFTPSGAVAMTVAELPQRQGRQWFRFEIRDTGIGISIEAQTRLFSEFNQVEASITRRFGGTGLGLAICRKLTEAMGGMIGVESTPGLGSCFWFTLPLDNAEEPARNEPKLRTHGPIQLAACDRLLADSLQAELAANGNEVMQLFRGQMPRKDTGLIIEAGALQRLRTLDGSALPRPVAVFGFGAKAFAGDCDVVYDGILTSRRLRVLLDRKATSPSLGPAVHAPEAATDGASVRRAHVLVVEDNSVNQTVAQGLLQRMGHTVELAENGAIAVEMVQSTSFDVVIMDMQMPVMDGLEATRRIRALGSPCARVPIIGLTANAFASDRAACLAAGMNGYQTKPVNRAKLQEALQAVFDEAGEAAAAPEPATGSIEETPAAEPPVDVQLFDPSQREQLADALGADSLEELTAGFWADAVKLLDRAVEAAASGDTSDLADILHTLKGASANLGLRRIAAESQAQHQLAKTCGQIDLGGIEATIRATRAEIGAQPSLGARAA